MIVVLVFWHYFHDVAIVKNHNDAFEFVKVMYEILSVSFFRTRCFLCPGKDVPTEHRQ